MWPRCKYVLEGHRIDGTPLPGNYQGTDIDGNVLTMQDGFRENVEYFRLDFLDPARVERGDAFEGILPIIWLMAGCIGYRDTRRGASPWYIAKHSPFAVLIRETHFLGFQEKLRQRDDITHVFLVTDSEENFMLMRRELGPDFHCLQLYKSYLENFRINAANLALTGKKEAETKNED
jgi:adenine-specific DNA-methyltransferase